MYSFCLKSGSGFLVTGAIVVVDGGDDDDADDADKAAATAACTTSSWTRHVTRVHLVLGN